MLSWLWREATVLLFPLARIILLVCQHAENVHLVAIVEDPSNQPVFVATYVKHNTVPHQISFGVALPQVSKVSPDGAVIVD